MMLEDRDEPVVHTLDQCPDEALTSLPTVDSLPTPEESATITEVSDRSSLGIGIEDGVSSAHEAKPASDDSSLLGSAKAKPLWRVWACEVASILSSICLLIVLVVVFSRFDGQSLPNWPLAITLNTFAAFISMASKAAFILPVSIAISQGQWDWFRKERPLYDFYVFDQASRGPWGSLIFLGRIHRRHMASIGAILMVVSAVTSPVTQLSISYPARDIEVQGNATVRASRSMFSLFDAQNIARRAVMRAVSMDTTEFSSPINPQGVVACSTGNCTFENYSSLGVCVEMANITSHLVVERIEDFQPLGVPFYDSLVTEGGIEIGAKVWKASLAEDLLLAHQYEMAMVIDNLNGNETFGFRTRTDLFRTRLASFVMIYSYPIFRSEKYPFQTYGEYIQDLQGVQHEAIEVLFYLCAQTYRTEVRVGQESTKLIGQLAQPTDNKAGAFFSMDCVKMMANYNDNDSRSCDPDFSRFQDRIYLESPCNHPHDQVGPVDACTFGANYSAFSVMSSTMRLAVSSAVMVVPAPPQSPRPFMILGKGETLGWTLYNVVLYSKESLKNSTIQNMRIKNLFTNFATSLSSEMRSYPIRDDLSRIYNITGKAWSTQPYVRINWGWISFLTVEIVMAVIFLSLTIMSQSMQQAREKQEGGSLAYRDAKDSSLAHLVALSNQCREVVGGGLEDMGKLVGFTKTFKVKIQGSEIVPSEDIGEPSSPADH